MCVSLSFFISPNYFSPHYSVLLFPALNSYRRFLIHKLCEKFPTLSSFSISQGYERRVLIYSRTNPNCIQNATKPIVINERWIFFIERNSPCNCLYFRLLVLVTSFELMMIGFVYSNRYNENGRNNSNTKNEHHSKSNQSSDKVTATTMGIKDLDALAKTIKRKFRVS